MKKAWILAIAAGAVMFSVSPSIAWDAYGHRTIAQAALERLAKDPAFPAWVLAGPSRTMIAYQSGEPDRWRATRTPSLKHENDPDHYIDLEDLTPFGLELQSMPRLRYEYVKALALAKQAHPEKAKPYNPAMDAARTQEYPGYLPYAIMDHYEKLRASFYNLRVLEALNDPSRADAIAMARANVQSEMGLLAHFVGDAAQPLHTTTHHHGWVGENPKDYTKDRTIHARVDGAPGLFDPDMQALTSGDMPALDADPWTQVLAEIQRSFAKVEPLYELEKGEGLNSEKGRAFIQERMADASATLAALYRHAWENSKVSPKDVEDFLRYDKASGRTEKAK